MYWIIALDPFAFNSLVQRFWFLLCFHFLTVAQTWVVAYLQDPLQCFLSARLLAAGSHGLAYFSWGTLQNTMQNHFRFCLRADGDQSLLTNTFKYNMALLILTQLAVQNPCFAISALTGSSDCYSSHLTSWGIPISPWVFSNVSVILKVLLCIDFISLIQRSWYS